MSEADRNLLAEIEQFLAEANMSASYFGKEAVGNSELVGRLRKGRSVTQKTADEVRHFIREERSGRQRTTIAAHTFPVRVYYEDTDFSGNVYHAAYLKFFERGRTEFLRAMGVHHSELARQGIAFAVRTMQVGFEAAAHIDDLLDVATRVLAVSGARLTLEQTILRDGAVVTRAEVVVVAIKTTGGPARLPQSLRVLLSSRD